MDHSYQKFDLSDLTKPSVKKEINKNHVDETSYSGVKPTELKNVEEAEESSDNPCSKDTPQEKIIDVNGKKSSTDEEKKAFVYKPPVIINGNEKTPDNIADVDQNKKISCDENIVDGIDMSYYEDTPVDTDDEVTHSNTRMIVKGILILSAIAFVITILLIIFCS